MVAIVQQAIRVILFQNLRKIKKNKFRKYVNRAEGGFEYMEIEFK